MSLSPEREQQIRAFEAAATPGPWRRHDDAEDLRRWVVAESNVLHIDADARTAVPELLAELDRVRAELARHVTAFDDVLALGDVNDTVSIGYIARAYVNSLRQAEAVPAGGEANR